MAEGRATGSRGEHHPVLFEPRERNKIKILLRSQWIYDIIRDATQRKPFESVFIVNQNLSMNKTSDIYFCNFRFENVSSDAYFTIVLCAQEQNIWFTVGMLTQCVQKIIFASITYNNELFWHI